MEASAYGAPLCSLTEWSIRHIRDIFEASSDEQSLRAISATFAEDLNASVNGAPLTREGIKQMVLAMRESSPRGLNVEWLQAVEASSDPITNRVSFVSAHDPRFPIETYSREDRSAVYMSFAAYRKLCLGLQDQLILSGTRPSR